MQAIKRVAVALMLALPLSAGAVESSPINDQTAAVVQQVESSVNINTATESELVALKGIGPAKAKAIVEYRTTHGPFASADALADVKGVGPATVLKNKSRITTQ